MSCFNNFAARCAPRRSLRTVRSNLPAPPECQGPRDARAFLFAPGPASTRGSRHRAFSAGALWAISRAFSARFPALLSLRPSVADTRVSLRELKMHVESPRLFPFAPGLAMARRPQPLR